MAKELEARLTALESQLKAKLAILDNQVRTLQDIEEIKKLQRSYGYYFEHWMRDEIVDLFADGPEVAIHLIGVGIFKGKEGVRRYFNKHVGIDPEHLAQIMQISGIVDVDPDGKTAKGRWYHWGGHSIPHSDGKINEVYMSGLYENEYIKQDGKWKIKVLRQCTVFQVPPGKGWTKPERIAVIDPSWERKGPQPDISDDTPHRYPSGYILPFHYKHPVTGKETSEGVRNASIKGGAQKQQLR